MCYEAERKSMATLMSQIIRSTHLWIIAIAHGALVPVLPRSGDPYIHYQQ